MNRFTSKHTMDDLTTRIKKYYQNAGDFDAFYDVFPESIFEDFGMTIGFSEGSSLWEDFSIRCENDDDEIPWEGIRGKEPEKYIKEFYKNNSSYEQMECLYLYIKDGFPIVICNANEDDEYPTFFIMYLDDTDKLRAYVPKKGNTFDVEANTPYEMDWDTGFENMHYKLNLKEFLEDIKENITFKET